MEKENHKTPVLAVDGILLKNNKILLLKRNIPPFENHWVLPGGHVEYGEKVEETILRELEEETGLKTEIKELIGVYSDPERDPRYHAVSIVYWLSKAKGEISINDESSDYDFFDLSDLPKKIGFDHKKIINDFKNHHEENRNPYK